MAMAPHIEMNKSTSVEEDEEQYTQIKTPRSIVHSRYVWPEKKKKRVKIKENLLQTSNVQFFSSSSS